MKAFAFAIVPATLARRFIFICAATLLVHAGSIKAATLPDADIIYPYIVANQDLASAIRYFGKNIGVGVNIDPGVTGKVTTKPRGELTRRAYLDQLAVEFGLVWFFDGTTLHVTPTGNVETEVFFLKHNDGATVLRTLEQLGLYQNTFLHRFDARNRVLLVSGPSAYVRMVKNTVDAIEKADRTETTVIRGTRSTAPPVVPLGTKPPAAP